MRVLNKPSAIFNLLSKCCEAKLEVELFCGKQSFFSYFLSYKRDQVLVLVNKSTEKNPIISGKKLSIKFSMVYGGTLHNFRIDTKVIKTDEFGNFMAVFAEYPQKIFEDGEISEFRIALPESKPAILNAYVGEEIYPQSILKLGIRDIQFHFNVEGKSKKNVIYIGKKFEDCQLIIHDFRIDLDVQIVAFEAGTIIAKMSNVDEVGMPLLKQFIQEVFIEFSEKNRFGWDSLNNIPFHENMIADQNKVLIVESDKMFNLAVRETLLENGFSVASIIEESNVLRIATLFKPEVLLINIDLDWDNGMNLARELQKNRITKNTPIIFIANENTSYTMKKIIDEGGVELLKKPLSSKMILEKVNSGILLKTQESKEEDIKILLLGQDNRRAAFLLSEWAGKNEIQIVYGTKIKDLSRNVIQKKIDAVFINTKGKLDKYILESCNKLHDLDMGVNVPVLIFNEQLFKDKIVKIQKMLYGLEEYNSKSFNFIKTLLKDKTGK